MNASTTVHPLPTTSDIQVLSIAYAGIQFEVHLSCQSPTGQLYKLTLPYATFSQWLRERANRKSAIALLDAFRTFNVTSDTSGLHRWNLLQVPSILGRPLQLGTASSRNFSTLQSAA